MIGTLKNHKHIKPPYAQTNRLWGVNRQHWARQGLLFYYMMNEAGGVVVYDNARRIDAEHGVFNGHTKWASGRNGPCTNYDGTTDYILDSNGGNLVNGLTEASISVWVKSNATGVENGFISSIVPNGSDVVFTMRYDAVVSGIYNNCIMVGIGGSSDATVTKHGSAEGVQTTQWQHLVATWVKGAEIQLYINGVKDVASYTLVNDYAISGATRLMVGAGSKDLTAGWNGLIDDLRIYGRALNESEAISLYYNQYPEWDNGLWVGKIGRIMSSLAYKGGLVYHGGIAGRGGGLAG